MAELKTFGHRESFSWQFSNSRVQSAIESGGRLDKTNNVVLANTPERCIQRKPLGIFQHLAVTLLGFG